MQSQCGRPRMGVEMTAFGGHWTSREMVSKTAEVLAHENVCWRPSSVRWKGCGRACDIYGPRGEVEGPAGRLELPRKLEEVLYAGGLGVAIRGLLSWHLTWQAVQGHLAALSSHHSPPISRPLYSQRHSLLFP